MQHLILSQVDCILVTGGDSRNFVKWFPATIRTYSGNIQRSFFNGRSLKQGVWRMESPRSYTNSIIKRNICTSI